MCKVEPSLQGKQRRRKTPTTYNSMKFLTDCLDSLIRAIQIISQSIAFLLGIHLVVTWHFIRFLATEPVDTIRRQAGGSQGGQRNRPLTTTTIRWRGAISRRRGFASSPPQLLHLPSLEPRPYDEPEEKPIIGFYNIISTKISSLAHKMKEEIVEVADQMEAKGGKTGDIITLLRKRSDRELQPALLQKLPMEIINHILLIASDSTPTTICSLSKIHQQLVIPRLYSTVELSNPITFNQFRLTMAVHRPNLGKYIRSLSVGSCTFDNQGYYLEAIAESTILGVGLEQILITAPNLKHLYLDLFSLAALHDGTGSRLQTGSLPISLTTEYVAPQYLSLPVFRRLRHVELNVFGLDKMAIDQLRQALPHVLSMTLRWVTRQSDGFDEADINSSASPNSNDFDAEGNEEIGDEDQVFSWSRGNDYFSKDFKLFVEALETLRTNEKPLEAITVLAWPKALRRLSQYYRHDKEIYLINSKDESIHQQDESAWDKSIGQQQVKDSDQASSLQLVDKSIRTPLRLAVDPAYELGPRRGPLESWINRMR